MSSLTQNFLSSLRRSSRCTGFSDEAAMLPCANRADKAGWPAPAYHRLPALILCSVKNSKLGLAKPLLKLHLVARHRSNPQKQPYVPVSYHALMAEDSA